VSEDKTFIMTVSEKQEKWLAHLSNESKIVIKPFDPTAEQKFQVVKATIESALGEDINVEHRGASSLGISGQDEIDVYIPVVPSLFDSFINPLTKLFGEPRSSYPMERTRFSTEVEGKHIDIFLINKESDGWIHGIIFENYLKSHPKALEEYRKLKEDGNGQNVQEYYRRKIEFINGILAKAKWI
jgi:GrpB-like predicted nucleotidyltransferase (UPF0157 family)